MKSQLPDDNSEITNGGPSADVPDSSDPIEIEWVDPQSVIVETVEEEPPREFRVRVWLPICLFTATCFSTWFVGTLLGASYALQHDLAHPFLFGLLEGLKYAVPLMTILLCHEMGHFIQARRYRVPATLPFFIPMPIPPIGTFGAVIAMDARMGNRKALFDIGITGPLAGLVPTIVFCVIGLHLSRPVPVQPDSQALIVGMPYLLSLLSDWIRQPVGPGQMLMLHPLAYAGWVGLLLTALNLMPIGQLDGGHVLYGLLRKKAFPVALMLFYGAVAAVIWYGLLQWWLMLILLWLIGARHPPTADDDVPLGLGRVVLGCLVLAFIPFGFTPIPFDIR